MKINGAKAAKKKKAKAEEGKAVRGCAEEDRKEPAPT